MKQQAPELTITSDEAVEAVARALAKEDGHSVYDHSLKVLKVTSFWTRAQAAIAAIRPYHFEEAAKKADDAASSCELQSRRAHEDDDPDKEAELRNAAKWAAFIAATIRAAK